MIKILVDSSSDIMNERLVNDNITMVPLRIQIADDTYLDRKDLDANRFYEILQTTKVFPKTSQPSPQDYVEIFEQAKANNDTLLCIMLSSKLSGTFQSALLAKSIVEYDNIHIVDSLSVSFGIELLVNQAKKMIEEGKTIEEIVSSLDELKTKIRIYASVETLDYLCMGGRIDKKSAMIGNLAKIKPIISVIDGKVEVIAKAIGNIKAMNLIVKQSELYPVNPKHKVGAIYTSGFKNVDKLCAKLNDAQVHIDQKVQLGPVVGSHIGSEAFGYIYICK